MAIVPFLGEGDEIVGSIIARLLTAEGIAAVLLSCRTLRAEKVERLKELEAPWILLSAIESRSVITVGKMAHSIKLEIRDALILSAFRLASEPFADVETSPGFRYAIVKITNGIMTARKGLWSWTAQEAEER